MSWFMSGYSGHSVRYCYINCSDFLCPSVDFYGCVYKDGHNV